VPGQLSSRPPPLMMTFVLTFHWFRKHTGIDTALQYRLVAAEPSVPLEPTQDLRCLPKQSYSHWAILRQHIHELAD
jgi:hypothetical protein